MKTIAIGVGENENIIQEYLKKHYPNLSRATYVNGNGHEFLLSPVGIDEGNTVDEKYEIVLNCIDFLKKVGKKPKIAVLAEGREDDFGRGSEVSNSIIDSKKLTKIIKENTSEDVENYFILIEKAINSKSNIIIAPNGRVGNIIFRTLVLLNSWPSHGAVTFGIDKTYIDTSRDQSIDGYVRSLILANELSK